MLSEVLGKSFCLFQFKFFNFLSGRRYFTKFLCLILLALSFSLSAQLDNPNWGDNSTSCVPNALLYPGVAVVTCGVVDEVPVSGRYVMAYLSMNNGIPTSAPFRDDITNGDSVVHHSDWLVSNIGNVFGTAINQQTAEVFVTASSNYGAGFGFLNSSPSVLNYGVIGSPANPTEAAGTVYRIDPITGAATVFARLPQQTVTLQHWDCEDDAIEITRDSTGVGLGNIAYDEIHNQYFVTNAEDGRIYRLSNTGTILDSYDPKSYDTGMPGIDSLQEVPYGIAVEPGSNRVFFGFVDDPGPGGPGAQALPGSPKIFSLDLDSNGEFVGTINNTNMPAGATYNNFVGSDQEHGSIPTSIPGGGFSYTNHTIYFISDLAFSPEGDLLVSVRVGCHGSWHSSYNHWAETDVITLNVANNLYDTTPFEYDISVPGDAAEEDSYGGVAVYELNDGSCDIHYLVTSSDVLSENGPHGITIFDSENTSSPMSPLGVFEYGVLPNEDPKGIGGDVEVYNGCSNSCNIAGSTVACEGDVISLTYTPDCPNSIFTWQIMSGNASIVGVNDSVVVDVLVGDTDFTASVILSGVASPCTHDVIVSQLQNPSINPTGPLCINGPIVNLNASPPGGSFSGVGIVNPTTGAFDPSIAGVGTHNITYSLPGICMESANTSIAVNTLPVVTFTAPADLCVDAGVQAGLGGGTPTGGVYSGPGVTDNGNGTDYDFDPSAAGVGVHTITYTYTDGNGCTNSADDDVEVFALPVVTFTAPADLCVDAGVQAGLGGGTPTGGVYSGTGVTDNGNGTDYDFDPSAAGVGAHTITYTYTDGNGCTNSADDDVEVFALPVVTFTAPADLCIDAGVQAGLGGGTPTGGVYSGPGVTDNGNGTDYDFDPSSAGVGVHTITYTYTDGNGCTNSADDDVEVFALPVVTFTALSDLCIDAGETGLGGGTPTGGVYSGPGVTDNGNGTDYDFDPSAAGVGAHTITYTYTDGNGCTNSADDDVEVFALPVVTFTALSDLCIDAGVQTGLGGGIPTGGVYSGLGVTDDGNGMTYSFDPSAAGDGIHTITYTYTDGNGCTNSADDDVEVFALPVVTFTAPADLCVDAGVQTGLGGGTPTGGVYSGTGVTDDGNGMTYSFDPSSAGVGVHTITYTFTDGNGCTNSADDDVEVFALPVVTFTALADLCIDAGVQTGLGGGTPTGGVYSGTGVTDNGNGMTYSFDPSSAGVGVQYNNIYVHGWKWLYELSQ